jgi:hypothetical protein
VLPTLLVAVSVVAVGVGVYGWVNALNAPAAEPAVTPVVSMPTDVSTPPPSPTPQDSASTSPKPSPSKSPSTSPSKSPSKSPSAAAVARDYPVVVLNQTAVSGLAAATAADLRRVGWTVTGVGNWRGDLTETTVYYPPGRESQARQLAKDLKVDRIRPRSSPMRSDRLTVILAGARG